MNCKNLTPFYWCMLESFPFIESTFDAIDNYQLLCKIVEYVNKMGTKTNELGIKVEELNNWFNTLNLQDEVNKKLDEMAESGELQEIINSFLQLKTAIIFPNVESMKSSENLINGSFAQTLGYYNIDDGGKTLYRILDGNYVNNNMDVIQLNNGLFAVMVKSKELNIKQFGAISDGSADNTLIFQNAVNYSDTIYVPKGIYNLSNTINIKLNTKIIGESMTDSILQNTSSADFPLFQYLSAINVSAYDNKTNIIFSNLKINSKYFIKINDNSLNDNQWLLQASLLALHFEKLWLNGTYGDDVNKDTNIIPTFDDLDNYGIAFNLNSVFDSEIINCNINGFGIGIYLKGCDINNINYNRMTSNGIHIMTQRISTYGSQTRICHNDILMNRRYGAITLNGTFYDTIEDNYFECYTSAGCALYSPNCFETTFFNNRIDNPSVNDINIVDISPVNCCYITNNRLTPSGYTCYINVNHNKVNLIELGNVNSAVVKDNNTKIRQRNNPLLLTDNYKPTEISPYNMSNSYMSIGGTLFKAPYIKLDDVENLYHFNDDGVSGNSMIFNFYDLRKTYKKPTKIRFYYKSTGASQFYLLAKGDGNQIYGNFVNLENDNTLHYVDLDLTSNTTLYNNIYLELVYGSYKIFAIELI